jgi:F-type H+-transporting ATPase subunit delta
MNRTKYARHAARQLFRACSVDGRLDEARAGLAAHRLAQSGRRGALATLTALQRLVRLDRDRHRAVVESAAALNDDLRGRLAAGLIERHGDGLETVFQSNPALIGGVRITVGSVVYDGSVHGRLAALKARL